MFCFTVSCFFKSEVNVYAILYEIVLKLNLILPISEIVPVNISVTFLPNKSLALLFGRS